MALILHVTASYLQTSTFGVVGAQYNYNTLPSHLKDSIDPDKDDDKYVKMLFLTDPSIERDKLVRIKGERARDTCEWITHNESFHAWRKGTLKSLWIRGKPGKGKTMIAIFLSKTLDLENGIYYFCVAADVQGHNATSVLRGFLWQLVSRHPGIKEKLRPWFKMKERATQALSSAETLWNIFMDLVSEPTLPRILCMLDGLDECDSDSRRWLATKFVDLNKSNYISQLRILIVSRDMPALNSIPQINLDISVTPGIATDIETFVSTSVQELSNRVSLGPVSLKQIRRTLLKRAEGTFLWIGFTMAALLEAQTELEIMRMINSQDQLPAGLIPMFERILSSIGAMQKAMSVEILRWVTISATRLSVEELAYLVHCKPEGTMGIAETMKDHIRLCGPLLELGSEGKDVGFVHESVRDYLARSMVDNNAEMEQFRVESEKAHFQAAQSCLHALGVGGPFTQYAAEYWDHHARRSGDLAVDLIEQERHFFQQHSSSRDKWWMPHGRDRLGTIVLPRLHLASFLGFAWWTKAILDEESCAVNVADDDGRTSLDHAIMHGDAVVVQLLIGHGADVGSLRLDTVDRLYATRESRKDLIHLLQRHGVDLVAENALNRYTSLMEAVSQGHHEKVRFLRDLGVDMGHANSIGETAMFALLRSSNLRDGSFDTMLDLLHEFGQRPDPHATNMFGQTLLHVTAWNGMHIERLLNIGSDVMAVDSLGNTPLHLSASRPGDVMAVGLLISHGASISAKNHSGKTALHMATEMDQIDGPKIRMLLADRDRIRGQRTRILLQHGADPNCVDVTGASPLHCWASLPGCGFSAGLLLQYGADIEACDDSLSRPLHRAVRRRRVDNARILLKHGADVDAREGGGRRALHLAVASKSFRMVEMLFDCGADLNARANGGLTPLHYAVWKNNEPMIKLLLNLEADIEAKDSGGWTVLHIAALEGRTSTVELLLGAKADVKAKGGHELTPLHLAAYAGYTKIVSMLIDSGADVSGYGTADTNLGRPSVTARDLAAWKRHTDVEQVLRDHGVAESSFPLMLFFLLVDLLQYFGCQWTSEKKPMS